MTGNKALERFGWPLLICFGLICLGFLSRTPHAHAAERPLSVEDVRLLLIGGATTEKMIGLIEQRGVDFRMNPDLAKKFHDDGASDEVIEVLQRAGGKVNPAQGSSAAPSSAATSSSTTSSKKPAVFRPTKDQITQVQKILRRQDVERRVARIVLPADDLILAEVALRVFWVRNFPDIRGKDNLGYRYDERLGWFPVAGRSRLWNSRTPFTLTHNSEGFRGPERDSDCRPPRCWGH